jgi:hypothetical protein
LQGGLRIVREDAVNTPVGQLPEVIWCIHRPHVHATAKAVDALHRRRIYVPNMWMERSIAAK